MKRISFKQVLGHTLKQDLHEQDNIFSKGKEMGRRVFPGFYLFRQGRFGPGHPSPNPNSRLPLLGHGPGLGLSFDAGVRVETGQGSDLSIKYPSQDLRWLSESQLYYPNNINGDLHKIMCTFSLIFTRQVYDAIYLPMIDF